VRAKKSALLTKQRKEPGVTFTPVFRLVVVGSAKSFDAVVITYFCDLMTETLTESLTSTAIPYMATTLFYPPPP
jgi:hypothetical protein